MVFVPFTTVDHHKKSVIVGIGLISKETIEAHEWKAPKIVLTDQDPAIKQAVESILPNSRHIGKYLSQLPPNSKMHARSISSIVWIDLSV
uniref:Uncharacterized protein n=1 Tax=Lactuca sativa TaxID=4236 RepID=A0A9R1WQV5_LACSA|nr:hypothetical protein LSAT_V11C900468700 [Lactuca sativa]